MPDENAPLPAAGWYPDPENAGQDRWWDGANWSDHRRAHQDAVVAAPAYAYGPAPVAQPASQPTPAYGYAGQPYAYPTPAPQNVPALVGFILAIVGFVLGWLTYGVIGIAGGVVSIVGLVKANQMKRGGEVNHRWGMALAGVIIGFSSIVLMILFFVLFLAAWGNAYADYPSYS